eukprot:s3351_g4.t1
MQQLRERAAKIVQHLTVAEVSGAEGIHVIKATMEKSPIIKILDTKKVDKRRQKFMRLGRLQGESIESFLNRAEIYRRENQSSPEYTVGSKFYIGHLLDAAKLTKRDLALLKAAAGGSLEEEEAVTLALLELADQLEGLPHCHIGKGETTLDNEDKFLVQKAGGASSTSATSGSTGYAKEQGNTPYKSRRRPFNRKRFRDALISILEDNDQENNVHPEMVMQELEELAEAGDESVDEDEEMSHATGEPALQPVGEQGALPSADASETSSTLMEIYAQEYQARNRVRELKKMRQYFQRDQRPGGQGQPEQVQKWVRERQQTDPCFLCGKLGHWSQECPLRKKPPVHASNVTFPGNAPNGREWDVLEAMMSSQSEHRTYMALVSGIGNLKVSEIELLKLRIALLRGSCRMSRRAVEQSTSASPAESVPWETVGLDHPMTDEEELQDPRGRARRASRPRSRQRSDSTRLAPPQRSNMDAAKMAEMAMQLDVGATGQHVPGREGGCGQLFSDSDDDQDDQEQGPQQEGRADGHRGPVPDSQSGVLRRPHLQHHGFPQEPADCLQMEGFAPTTSGQSGHRTRATAALEAQSSLADDLARTATGRAVGPSGGSPPIVLESQNLLSDGPSGGSRIPEQVSQPSSAQVMIMEDGMDIVFPEGAGDGALLADPLPDAVPLPGDDLGRAQHAEAVDLGQEHRSELSHPGDSGQGELPPTGTKKKLVEPLRTPVFAANVNRGQKQAIIKGLGNFKQTREVLEAVIKAQPTEWCLFEIFAGKATLSLLARQMGWRVVHPQDIALGGLDLTNLEHHELIKDVLRAQQPDVVTLSPRCGPWSSWQRIRKDKRKLRQEREAEMPVWDLVEWIWDFQTSRGALAILEQPWESEALNLPSMARRKLVYTKKVHQCAAGLRDAVSGKPHKKSTAFQANHPSILKWRDLLCPHQPGEHQPIEGNVMIPQSDGSMLSVKRSTLAAQWTVELCQWIMDGVLFSMELMNDMVQPSGISEVFHLHTEVDEMKVWHNVPVEREANPEALLRQQMAEQSDYKTKYDYISFKGVSATLSRQFRNMLAHLHVCLGHIGKEKLCRMLALNGAKDAVLQGVKDLDCQICNQVQSPTPAPKAAFARPTSFNQRIVMDTFYVWDITWWMHSPSTRLPLPQSMPQGRVLPSW